MVRDLTAPDCCQFEVCGPLKGESIERHCDAGLHCHETDASCAASWAVDDHLQCCSCGKPLSRSCP